MAQKGSTPTQRLLTSLRNSGPQSPGDLMGRLEVSQPTLYRAAKAQPDKVIALGARRNRKLAALRDVRGLGASLPVFQVTQDGEVESVGKILAFHPSFYGFVLDANPTAPRFYSSLPSFLLDARPNGFLGDAFARRHPDLELPERSELWTNDDILEAMCRRGEDLPGNLLIGEESFARYQERRALDPEPVTTKRLPEFFLSSAKAADEGRAAGPLLGGKQAKFCALIEGERNSTKSVLVKFSPLGDGFAARRWRDLLVAEWLALETLRESGLPASDARLIEGGGRYFLEIERFDRSGSHGRRRVLSAPALGALPAGPKGTWATVASQLVRANKLFPEELEMILRLECFGRMIANNDRADDNLAFLWAPGEARATLAPAFDMLPMRFAPGAKGEDPGRTFPIPICEQLLLPAWKRAQGMAQSYWDSVLDDPRVSSDFKELAQLGLKALG